jgi:mannose-1-phosphate guanylyltransferase
MLPVLDQTMIERVIRWLAPFGVTDAVLSLGYRPEPFLDAYPDGNCAGVKLHYAVEPEPLDTAGAMRFAAKHAAIDERFLLVNGDVLTDLDVSALWKFHEAHDAECSIHLVPVEDPSRYGVVPIDDEGRVEAFIEKPPADDAPSNWINAGTYVLEPSVIDRVPDGRKVSIERETFPAMVADRSLYAMQSEVYWVDAGTAATYLQVQLDLVDGVRGWSEPAIAPSATIDATAEVTHSVVLDGARIGSGAVVRDSAILPGAVVREGAQINGSVVGPGSIIGAGATLDDLTVTGEGADIPAGANLSGARVPESD